MNKTLTRDGADPKGRPDVNELEEIQSTSQSPQPKRGRQRYFLTLLGAITMCAFVGLVFWMYAQGREETDDAYVDGHITTISSRIAGTVTQLLVEDNQMVTLNQPLVRLDPRDYQARVDQLTAALDVAERNTLASQSKIGQSALSAKGQAIQATGSINSAGADLDRSKAALLAAQAEERQAISRIRQQEAQIAYDKSDYDRYNVLWAEKAVTKQQYDRALETLNVAQAQLQEAQDALDQDKRKVLQAAAGIKDAAAHQLTSQGQLTSAIAAEKQTDIDKHQFQSNLAAIDQARFDLKQAQLQLSYTKIDAPVTGKAGRKSVEVGQRLEVGQALMAIVQPNPWVTANFKEVQLNKMRIGQKAEIKIDAFPGKVFTGHVDSFSPASGAKFSVLPPDNATGNFTKVVQRIPVKIVFDEKSLGAYSPRIRPGMSCITTVTFK